MYEWFLKLYKDYTLMKELQLQKHETALTLLKILKNVVRNISDWYSTTYDL